MKRTYSVKFKSASKKLNTEEKLEAAKKSIIEDAKADSVEIMDEGQIKEQADPEEFFGHPKDTRLQEFLSKVL